MNKIMMFTLGILILVAVPLGAAIDWSGNIWPNSETWQVASQDISVYYQIYKDGITNPPGQGEDLSATILYKLSEEEEFTSVPMEYFGDVGNNDEYLGIIPHTFFNEGDVVNFYCEGYDSTDGTYSYGTDQNQAGPFDAENPGIYNIGSPTSQDVTVTFQVDMSLVSPIEMVSVAGAFNNWTAGQDELTDPDMDMVFTGEVLFPEGSNPSQQYKFVNGTDWEYIENRSFLIDDSSPAQVLPIVFFNNEDPANYTTQEVTVTIDVDVIDSVLAGCVFDSLGIYGSVAPLDWEWEIINNPLAEIVVGELWSIDVVFPEGSYKYVNFKLGRNGLDLEAGFDENHSFTIDDSNPFQAISCTYGTMGPVNSTGSTIEWSNVISTKNYPNPFSDHTQIFFNLQNKVNKNIAVSIFNIKGQLVKTLHSVTNSSGKGEVIWNATNTQGNRLPAGIYFYKLDNTSENCVNKMIILR